MLDMMVLFQDKKSVPVLYTYDSILFDFCIEDGTAVIQEVLQVLTEDNKYPMRIYYGTTYNEMKRLHL